MVSVSRYRIREIARDNRARLTTKGTKLDCIESKFLEKKKKKNIISARRSKDDAVMNCTRRSSVESRSLRVVCSYRVGFKCLIKSRRPYPATLYHSCRTHIAITDCPRGHSFNSKCCVKMRGGLSGHSKDPSCFSLSLAISTLRLATIFQASPLTSINERFNRIKNSPVYGPATLHFSDKRSLQRNSPARVSFRKCYCATNNK